MDLHRLEQNFHAVPGHDCYGELRLNLKRWECCPFPSWDMCSSWHSIDYFNQEKFLKDPKLISKIIYPDNLPVLKTGNKVMPAEREFHVFCPDGENRWSSHACRDYGEYEGTNLPGKYDFSGWWKCDT